MDRDLKEKYELQALFDLSKALNSSLNLKTILDTILLTPMGKLLIAKGLVLLTKGSHAFAIEALKGLPKSLAGKIVEIDEFPETPTFVRELKSAPWQAFLLKNGIDVIIPVLHDGKELGLVGFGKKIVDSEFTDSDLDYLHSLSNIAATAVQNGIIFQELNTANRKLEKKVQELNTLSEIVRELNSTLSTLESSRVVNLLAYSIMGEMMVNRCVIVLRDQDELILALNRGLAHDKVTALLQDAVASERLKALERPVLVSDLDENGMEGRITDAGITALVPMRIENTTKGLIALGDKITKLPFVEDELSFLSILGSWSMMSIETARLIEQELEKKKLEEELRIAGEIQRQLLPDSCPQIEGIGVAAVNYPSFQIGGDYYDCLRLDNKKYLFCIADVSGKGAPAALLMSNLQASLHALINSGMTLSEMVARINRIIYNNTGHDKFITAFFCILDLEERRLLSVNAGHNPPYLYHKDGSHQTLNDGGLILGMMPNVKYDEETVQLVAGDCLLMYTDGVSEAMNSAGEEFEEQRIEKCIADTLDKPVERILEHLIETVRVFSAGRPQADDITALTLKLE